MLQSIIKLFNCWPINNITVSFQKLLPANCRAAANTNNIGSPKTRLAPSFFSKKKGPNFHYIIIINNPVNIF